MTALIAWTLVAALGAPATPAELPPVAVQGESTASREQQTVADLIAVLDVFERERATYAPNAELRIRVLPRRDLREQPALELRHGGMREPVLVDGLGRFTVPAAWRQLPPGAIVRSALKSGHLAWMVDVRTPGLPAHTRRVGDLRLACRADLYGGALARGIKPPAFYAMRAVTDVCRGSQVVFGFFADEPVFATTLNDASQRTELAYRWMHGSELGQRSALFPLLDWPYALRDRFVALPPAQWPGWPNDATLELEPMTP